MGRWKKIKQSRSGLKEFKPNFVVLARNVKTGALVRIPVTTRDEIKRMKWYPTNDYVYLDINPKFNPKTDRKRY
jgi:hypothetical protein